MSGLICVALDPGPGQWLLLLANYFKTSPPPFSWHLALGTHSSIFFGEEFEEHLITRNLGYTSRGSEIFSYLAEKDVQVGGILLASAGWQIELSLLQFAQRNRIPTGQYIETWYGYRNRLVSFAQFMRYNLIFYF